MAIWDLYSKRKLAAERPANDIYNYDSIPPTVRTQLAQMYEAAYDADRRYLPEQTNLRLSSDDFETLVKALRREYGVNYLGRSAQSYCAELCGFLNHCDTDLFLDCVELFGRIVSNSSRLNVTTKQELLTELNHRLREASLGYEYSDGIIIRIDTTLLHAEVLKPALLLLSSEPIYAGSEHELLSAFEHFRSHKNKEAVVDANKAF